MTGLHPDIARMRGAESDADRATVLLEAPVRVLMLYRQVFCDTALAGATTTLLGVIEQSATVVRQAHDEGAAQ